MKALKTLIVEDELDNLIALKRVLQPLIDTNIIHIAKEVMSLDEAIAAFSLDSFDLSILDIQLGIYTCYELLDVVNKDKFGMITFNTIQPCLPKEREDDIGEYLWLPKPYSILGVADFVNQLHCKLHDNYNKNAGGSISEFMENLSFNIKDIQTILGSRGSSEKQIKPYLIYDRESKVTTYLFDEQIYFIETDDNFCKIFYFDRNKNEDTVILWGITLKVLFELLTPSVYYRCHESYVITQKIIVTSKKRKKGGIFFTSLKCTPMFCTRKKGWVFDGYIVIHYSETYEDSLKKFGIIK